jgi:hypothetical protein
MFPVVKSGDPKRGIDLKPQVQREGIMLRAFLGEEYGVDVNSKPLISFENERREHES